MSMTKDQQVFIISVLEVREGVFVSESVSASYILTPENNSVSLIDKKYIFESKDLALECLVGLLKDKLKSIATWETRVKESLPLLDKIEKISAEFDLKKKEVTK